MRCFPSAAFQESEYHGTVEISILSCFVIALSALVCTSMLYTGFVSWESGFVSWNVLAVFSVCSHGTFARVSFYSRALASTCTVGFVWL